MIGDRDFVRLDRARDARPLPLLSARRPAANRHTEVMERTGEFRVLVSPIRA
jgi:hypothetical protein